MPKTRSAVEEAAERFISEMAETSQGAWGGVESLRRAVLAARKARAKKGATK